MDWEFSGGNKVNRKAEGWVVHGSSSAILEISANLWNNNADVVDCELCSRASLSRSTYLRVGSSKNCAKRLVLPAASP